MLYNTAIYNRVWDYIRLKVSIVVLDKVISRMPGDPQPVIYYHGNKSLFNLAISKELSERLIGVQNAPATKSDDILTGSFSSICRGFCFVPFDSIIEEEQERATFYSEPCLHIYWTDCCDQDQYKSSIKPEITKWIQEVEKIHATVGWLIVYCVTKESKAKRKQLGEKIKNEFCSKPEQYSLLKLFSSDMSRVLDSWNALVTKINTLSFNTFQRNMQPHIEKVNKMIGSLTSADVYSYFLYKLDIAISYEMCCRYEQALSMYNELHLLLEQTVAKQASEPRSQHPHWLKKMTSSWYQCWDCPDLTHPEKSWKYIVPIHSGSAPLLVIRTFIFMREASLLSMLCRSWLLAERALQVLHSAARETRAIKFNYPDGVFEAWAYTTCMETVSAILSQLSRANLEDMTSSLLLIRASLWEYGLQKLHKLGKICQLVPTSDAPDDHLISRITSGITQQPANAGSDYEDHGQLLIEILKSKQSFTSKYLELGEMVIGAFKHAGRKRTAFTVGLQMAKFHMELGMISEAEQLLNDMCSLYCPERWTMFSANAVSLLAECQKSLHLDSKYLRSLLLLTVLPPVVGTSHDPKKCLDEIIEVSQSIQSDVILDWSPLFSVVKVTADNSEYIVSNTVTVTISLRYHGQKDLMVDTLSLLMRTSIKSLIQSPEVAGGQSLCSGILNSTTSEDADPITLSTVPPENLYDLDIDSNYSDSSEYRPLSDQSYLKKTISETFSSYSLDRASIGMDGAFEEEGNEPEFVISTANVVLHPGENELKLCGEPATSGQYYGRKLTLSVGKLSFVSMVTSSQWSKGVPVLLKPIEISFGLEPVLGAFYAGVVQKCKIRLETGPDNPIPQDSILDLSCGTGIKFIPEPGSLDFLSEMTLSLPAISQSSKWSEHLLIYLPSIYKTPKVLVGGDDFVFTLKAPAAWNHEVVISCQWLMPPHVATLPITSPEPLSIDHQIYCTPDRSFLQFIVTSHWPHGVKLGKDKLTIPKSVSSEPLQVLTPEVLWNEESFSYLWELQCADLDANFEQDDIKCVFDVSSQLVLDNDTENLSVNHKYPFALPGVNALYCIECTVEPVSGDRVKEKTLCQLKITIRCCSPLGTDCPKKFRYSILHDECHWHVLQGVSGTAPIEKASRTDECHWHVLQGVSGTAPIEKASKTVQIKVDVVPQIYGELPIPIVNVTHHSRRRTSVKGSGQEDVFVPVNKSLVYNSSRGMRIYVYSDS